jgi:hypothetical protein
VVSRLLVRGPYKGHHLIPNSFGDIYIIGITYVQGSKEWHVGITGTIVESVFTLVHASLRCAARRPGRRASSCCVPTWYHLVSARPPRSSPRRPAYFLRDHHSQDFLEVSSRNMDGNLAAVAATLDSNFLRKILRARARNHARNPTHRFCRVRL